MSRTYFDTNRSDPNTTPSEIIGLERSSSYNLVENNTIIFVGIPLTSGNSEQVVTQLNSVKCNIIRKNISNNVKGTNAIYNNWNTMNNEYNLWYNNTFYKINNFTPLYGVWNIEADSGYFTRYNQFVNNIVHTSRYKGFMSGDEGNTSYIVSNQFRSNIMYNVGGVKIDKFTESLDFVQGESKYPDEFSGTITTAPRFTNATNGDFSLQSDSPAIDKGAWLTTITSSSGSGTSFTVSNPYFFYDGWGIPNEFGDVIKTENGQTATIISVNHSLKRIKVNKAISWKKNEGIALNYQGAKPDIGAKEYLLDNKNISPPKDLKIITN
jgi:hypothetical protein